MPKNLDTHSIRSRPRFKIKTNLSQEEFNHRLERQFLMQNKILGGYIGKDLSVIRMRKDKHKYWAPQLQIRTELDEDNAQLIVIRGLFGPKPAVWTLFMFLYIFGATMLSFFGMIWVVKLRLAVTTNLDIWAWFGLFIIAATYAAARIGQILAKQQMDVLKTFMEKVIDDELSNQIYAS